MAFINATGATFTKGWATSFGSSANQTINGYDQAAFVLKQISNVASATDTEVGAVIGGQAAILADFLGGLGTGSASNQTTLWVTTTDTLQFVSSVENDFFSYEALGPGDGDVIVYLKDVKFAYFTFNGQTTFVPLGYQGPTPVPVYAASLRPGASNAPPLPDAVKASLLVLDPIANGNPMAFSGPQVFAVPDLVRLELQGQSEPRWTTGEHQAGWVAGDNLCRGGRRVGDPIGAS